MSEKAAVYRENVSEMAVCSLPCVSDLRVIGGVAAQRSQSDGNERIVTISNCHKDPVVGFWGWPYH